jgi:DNA end-binding protein Ku
MKIKKINKKPAVKGKIKHKEEGPENAPIQGIWSGTISFSLVAIPVRLVKAVEPGRVSFHMLHNKDYSPLKRKMFCPDEQKIVPPEEIIRGYEIAPGKHLIITDEELESVSPDRSRTIEITEFIDAAEVDPVYYDHPYFLAPLKGGEKSYSLLVEAMQRTHRAGVAKFVLGEREYLVTIKSRDGALELCTLHYSGEITPVESFAPVDGGFDPAEKDSIKNSIKKMMSDFAPEKYSDPRRAGLMELLKKKAKERPVEAPEAPEEAAEGMEDLVAALEDSMRKMKKS